MLTINLPKEAEDRLEALAQQTHRSKEFYACEAILDALDDLEDAVVAEQRLDDLYAGRSSTCSLEEVERDLGLAD